MDQSRLDALHAWFDGYVRTFCDTDPDGLRNIRLKVEHTRRVCEIMAALSAGEGLTPEEARIAAAVALLHDVGRFPQYRRWRTFRDSDSDNHARLSVEVMREERLLEGLPRAEILLIEEAVRFHNLMEPPRSSGPSGDLFVRLVRDADKLDIWRVFLEFFQQPPEERASAAGLGFADLPEVSPACVEALAAGQVVRLDTARTLDDFKLLQISWVFDLNFTTSFRLLRERGYLEQLAATLPPGSGVAEAVAGALAEVERRAEPASRQGECGSLLS
jgi:hypothetical protein